MFDSNRIKYVAFGVIGTLIFSGFVFAAWQTRPSLKPEDVSHDFVWNCDQKQALNTNNKQDSPQKQTAKSRAKIAVENKANSYKAVSAKAECESVKREESDLRAQWVAAESARSSYWLGFVNFVALLLTLVAAGWAAWASQRSADAAVKTVEIAKLDNRPWIKVTGGQIGEAWLSMDEKYVATVEYSIENVGKSPAIDIKTAFMKSYDNFTQTELDDFKLIIKKGRHDFTNQAHILFPYDPRTFGHAVDLNRLKGIFSPPSFPILVYVAGIVQYRMEGSAETLISPFVLGIMASAEEYKGRMAFMHPLTPSPT